MGSILAFAIYEFNSGVAFQVSALIGVGLLFAYLVHSHILQIPSYFVTFITGFSTPLITNLVLVLVFVGMGLKMGWQARSFMGGDGLRIFSAATVMAFADIIPGAILFGFLCQFIFGWPWAYGALVGTLMGETSAAVVVPYVDHIMNLSKEKGSSNAHASKLTNVLKLESTLNSITLLLFLVLFYNIIDIGNVNPTAASFISTTWSSFLQVVTLHWPVLLLVIAGIPVAVYLSSRLLVIAIKAKLVDRDSRKLKVTAVFSMNEFMLPRNHSTQEFGEKQFRIGMMMYGIILGIALLIYETIQTQPATSFAGFGRSLFSLMALLYLGFFLGYLFPGSSATTSDSIAEQTGKQAFTGMMLFHEEFELLARIVFYFSIGVSLGFMILSPLTGSQAISSGAWTGILAMAIIMGPIFLLLRYISGLVGLPITFYSRYRHDSYRKDFRLVATTMPKGITVAAVAVLILQSGVEFSSEIYILALLAVVISTVGFTVISSLRMRPARARISGSDTQQSQSESPEISEN